MKWVNDKVINEHQKVMTNNERKKKKEVGTRLTSTCLQTATLVVRLAH